MSNLKPFCVIFLAVLCNQLLEVKADCCRKQSGETLPWCEGRDNYDITRSFCEDCTEATPYCGYGKCNIFACNCDGGCRKKPDNVEPTVDSTLSCVNEKEMFNLVDVDRNGLLSFEEINQAYDQTITKPMLSEVDTSGDGMINFEEFLNA